jgi:hypothetical protein
VDIHHELVAVFAPSGKCDKFRHRVVAAAEGVDDAVPAPVAGVAAIHIALRPASF